MNCKASIKFSFSYRKHRHLLPPLSSPSTYLMLLHDMEEEDESDLYPVTGPSLGRIPAMAWILSPTLAINLISSSTTLVASIILCAASATDFPCSSWSVSHLGNHQDSPLTLLSLFSPLVSVSLTPFLSSFFNLPSSSSKQDATSPLIPLHSMLIS